MGHWQTQYALVTEDTYENRAAECTAIIKECIDAMKRTDPKLGRFAQIVFEK
jgi:hypothetical protein